MICVDKNVLLYGIPDNEDYEKVTYNSVCTSCNERTNVEKRETLLVMPLKVDKKYNIAFRLFK